MRQPYRQKIGLRKTAAGAAAVWISAVSAAFAAGPYGPPSITISKQLVSQHEPVTIQSDQLDYDKTNDLAIATGHVEVSQGQTMLMADTLVYDHAHNVVYAKGHVAVLEPSGNVYFADELELENDMGSGVAEQFRARFSDGSLMAAKEAVRKNPSVTDLLKAVYSPCAIVCADGTPKTPQWQLMAGEAVIDRDAQRIVYRNAYMEAYGVPVFYTPYMSQPTPGAENESGLLTPSFQHNSNLGTVVAIPVYWAIAPDKDLTLTPMYASLVSPVLLGEYRERFDDGQLKVDGSFTRTEKTDAAGNPVPGSNVTRGHIFADGDFDVNQDWRWGFNIRRATDDTYLRVYNLNYDPILTSRVYGEGFGFAGDPSRSYALVESLAFQGMEVGDNPRQTPLVLPVANFYYESLPLIYNSRLSLTGDIMSLTRQEGDDSRRLSVTGRWRTPYVTDDGQLLEFAAQLRADAYDVNSVSLPDGGSFTGFDGRVMPEADVMWRYPLLKTFSPSTSLIVEPMVQAIVSADSGNTSKIPNEDSAIPEFTDANLFAIDRYPGYDRVETGPRMNYGVRSQLDLSHGFLVDGLAGQSWRANSDSLFPISSDPNSHFSDYVGRVGMSYQQWLDLAYRFRLDKDSLGIRRSEFVSTFHVAPVSVNISYLNIEKDPILDNNSQVIGGIAYDIDKNWSINLNADRDLVLDSMVNAGGGITYHNECLTAVTNVNRDLTSAPGYRPGTAFTLEIFLKNLS